MFSSKQNEKEREKNSTLIKSEYSSIPVTNTEKKQKGSWMVETFTNVVEYFWSEKEANLLRAKVNNDIEKQSD